MKKTFLLIAAFGALFLSLTANASLDVGEGARLCKEYAKKPLDKKPSYIHWVQGFFSAFNALDSKTHSILGEGKDYNWVREWLDNYCKSNPQMYFGEAVRILVEELYPNRIPNAAAADSPAPAAAKATSAK